MTQWMKTHEDTMGSQVWAWSNREFVWQMGFSTAVLWPVLTKRFFVYFHAVKMLKNDSFDRISHENLIKWLKTPKLQYSIWTLITLCSLSLMDESFHWPPVINLLWRKNVHRLPPKWCNAIASPFSVQIIGSIGSTKRQLCLGIACLISWDRFSFRRSTNRR